MRAAALACTLGLLAACGRDSSPTSPAGLTPSLLEGTYELRFSPGSAAGGPGYEACLSMFAGRASTPDPQASLVMRLTPSGDGWLLRMPNASGPNSGDLAVAFGPSPARSATYPAGSAVSGTARGTAIDGQGQTVRVASDDGQGDALLLGAVARNSGHGDVTGQVSIQAGDASVTCSPVNWALIRR